jgi:hypothetical protein
VKPSQFDFVRFREFMAEREERIRGFLTGTSDTNLLLVEKAGGDYTICRTPQESLECQLDIITRQMDSETDYIPFLEPWFGVGVYANAFGAEYVWIEGTSAQTHYVAFSPEQASRLQAMDIGQSPVMRTVLEAIDYFVDQTRGEIPISCTDTQSPFDTATLLWETSSFFTSMHTDPQVVHALLDRITVLIEEFSRVQIEHMGTTWSRPGHIMVSATGGPGFSVSDDNIVMVGPDDYASVAVPYNERLARTFGGLAVHSCGNFERQLPALMQTEGLVMVDGAFSGRCDPNPNLDYELFRDTLKGTGVMLQARMHLDWPEILPRLYDPDLRLVAAVPGPGRGEPREKNRMLLEETLCQCA